MRSFRVGLTTTKTMNQGDATLHVKMLAGLVGRGWWGRAAPDVDSRLGTGATFEPQPCNLEMSVGRGVGGEEEERRRRMYDGERDHVGPEAMKKGGQCRSRCDGKW